VDSNGRSASILTLDLKDPLQQSTNALLISKIRIIQEALFRWYGIRFPQAEPCSILRYLPGQKYKRHVDNLVLSSRVEEMQQGIPTRDVSLVGYLNDDFEGGETLFDRQHLKVQPQAGSVLFFPAYYTHPHQSLPVRLGKKYAWTSWLYH
jgi:predicted 2-oxoglutarate/Fe(II)-dependent dioxygenase YbiX